MKRRSSATISMLLGAALTAAFLAGCSGTTVTPPRSAIPAITQARPSVGASGSVAVSGSPGPSDSASSSASVLASPTGCTPGGLPHADASLEDLLPATIGGICLEKWSSALSAYIASSTGAENALYAPWLVKFGKTPDDVNMAVAEDLTQTVNFNVRAIKVPGVADATLSSAFGDVARQAGWPVSTKSVATRTVLEIIDPAAAAAGSLSAGYVYAKNNVLYIVLTDNSALLLEALIKLP